MTIAPYVAGAVIPGSCRNEDAPRRHHLYQYVEHECVEGWCSEPCADQLDIFPMCEYGWNRSNGAAFSILRGVASGEECRFCRKAADAGRAPVIEARGHRTKWI
jgi:hypothetical protein